MYIACGIFNRITRKNSQRLFTHRWYFVVGETEELDVDREKDPDKAGYAYARCVC